jgi:hypothetical protein
MSSNPEGRDQDREDVTAPAPVIRGGLFLVALHTGPKLSYGAMEEILPPITEEGAGFEPPRVRQFTVFLENKVGRLQMLVRALEESRERIVALSIQESADAALVRVICANADSCHAALMAAGFSFMETELLAVELPPGSRQPLIAICSALLTAELNIHYAYPLLLHPRGPALALYVDDPTLGAQMLIKKGFTLIAESDLRPGPGAPGNNGGGP